MGAQQTAQRIADQKILGKVGKPQDFFARLVVDYYGAPTPVQQLASFQVPEPRMAIVTPYDKTALGAIERAIRPSPSPAGTFL